MWCDRGYAAVSNGDVGATTEPACSPRWAHDTITAIPLDANLARYDSRMGCAPPYILYMYCICIVLYLVSLLPFHHNLKLGEILHRNFAEDSSLEE